MSQNRLTDSLSPYLRQHADNPVYWQPWDAAAQAQARREDKPILLSIGYAACHWCHVMAHESFTDPHTAAVMNKYFVNIKVDREERPDLDRIYQAAHYMFVRRAGGWPLTMFLTPSGEPFYGGTYFPRQSRHGLPSFVSVLEKVAEAWHDKRADINEQNAHVLPALRDLDSHPKMSGEMTAAPLEHALHLFGGVIDKDEGGFRGAPKFPHPVEMELCMSAASMSHQTLQEGVYASLDKMAAGGLCDHVGGGFFRYCVDAAWAVPHFEKMLYDNGLLLALFTDAARAFASDASAPSDSAKPSALPNLHGDFADAAVGIGEWVLAEMQHAEGGFYSSLDADSAGGEGEFYIWDDAELRALLPDEEYAVFASHYGLAAGANFEGRHHLRRRQSIVQTARAVNVLPAQCDHLLDKARRRLQKQRATRVRPATDDKILAAWNGLMIRGLARGGRILQKPQWLAAAREALNFVCREMIIDGRLHAVWREGRRGTAAFLDDCAFMLDGALELLQAEMCPQVLSFATVLGEQLCKHFEDAAGGFYFSATDAEQLIRRPKPADDSAIPSGNGVAARALLQLFWLTGDARWAVATEKTLSAFYGAMSSQPAGCASLLSALRWHLSPPQLVFLSGDSQTCKAWRAQLECTYRPDVQVYILPPKDKLLQLPLTLQKPPPPTGAYIYICCAAACQPPVDSLAAAEALLSQKHSA